MIHGGDIYTEGIFKQRKLLDYSSNINPLGVPEVFSDNIKEALGKVTVYPDIHYRKLVENVKKYIGLESAGIVLGNGASEIIDLSISLFNKVLIVVPSFVEYELDAVKWGCEIEFSYLSSNMEIDYEDIEAKLAEADALVIGNPNNPNGGVISKSRFKKILDFCEANEKIIIIDEAFIEFTGKRENSFSSESEEYKCLFIIRAMTKFFAMPGIRFGYAHSKNSELINKIKAKQNPWNINCFAEMAAEYCLGDKNYIEASIDWINEERSFMLNELKNVKCIEKVFLTFANFVLCKIRNIDENELYKYCLDRGIVIRKAGNFRGLNEYFIRLAIKDRASNEKLLAVLNELKV